MANFSSFFPAAGGGGGTPPGTYYIEYLAVGGGGGGASKATGGAGGGGGGGAGGFINNFFVTPAGVVTTISVGGGGAGAPAGENNGNDGYPTLIGSNAIGVISGVNAVGGGGGGMGGGGAFVKPGRTGGSSGGSCNGTFTDPSLPSTNSQTYGLLIQGGSGKNGNGTVQGGAGGSAGTTQLLAPNTALCHSDDGAMTTIINSSNATTSSVGEINATNVYFSSGGA